MPARKATHKLTSWSFRSAALERARGNDQVARIELAGAKRRLLIAADEYTRKQDQANRCAAELRTLEAKYKK